MVVGKTLRKFPEKFSPGAFGTFFRAIPLYAQD